MPATNYEILGPKVILRSWQHLKYIYLDQRWFFWKNLRRKNSKISHFPITCRKLQNPRAKSNFYEVGNTCDTFIWINVDFSQKIDDEKTQKISDFSNTCKNYEILGPKVIFMRLATLALHLFRSLAETNEKTRNLQLFTHLSRSKLESRKALFKAIEFSCVDYFKDQNRMSGISRQITDGIEPRSQGGRRWQVATGTDCFR